MSSANMQTVTQRDDSPADIKSEQEQNMSVHQLEPVGATATRSLVAELRPGSVGDI